MSVIWAFHYHGKKVFFDEKKSTTIFQRYWPRPNFFKSPLDGGKVSKDKLTLDIGIRVS
jgi:hypothetical protein